MLNLYYSSIYLMTILVIILISIEGNDNSVLLMGAANIPIGPTSINKFDAEAFIKNNFKPRTLAVAKWSSYQIKLHWTHIAAIVFLLFLDLIKFEQNGKNYRIIFKVSKDHIRIGMVLKALKLLQPLSYNKPIIRDGIIYFRTLTLPCLTEFRNKYLINGTINLEVLDLLTRNYLYIAGAFTNFDYELPIQSSLFDDKQMNIICDKLTKLFEIEVIFDPNRKILRTWDHPAWIGD